MSGSELEKWKKIHLEIMARREEQPLKHVRSDSEEHMASPIDTENNAPLWVPACEECLKNCEFLSIPREPSEEMYDSFLKPADWVADIVEAFFFSIAHAITLHNPMVRFLQFCSPEEYHYKAALDKICSDLDKESFTFFPFHYDIENPHMVLLRLHNNVLKVYDCGIDPSKDKKKVKRKEMRDILLPITTGFQERTKIKLGLSFASKHFLMSTKVKADWNHCGANVCANLVMAILGEEKIKMIVPCMREQLEEMLQKFGSCGGPNRRKLIISLLYDILPPVGNTILELYPAPPPESEVITSAVTTKTLDVTSSTVIVGAIDPCNVSDGTDIGGKTFSAGVVQDESSTKAPCHVFSDTGIGVKTFSAGVLDRSSKEVSLEFHSDEKRKEATSLISSFMDVVPPLDQDINVGSRTGNDMSSELRSDCSFSPLLDFTDISSLEKHRNQSVPKAILSPNGSTPTDPKPESEILRSSSTSNENQDDITITSAGRETKLHTDLEVGSMSLLDKASGGLPPELRVFQATLPGKERVKDIIIRSEYSKNTREEHWHARLRKFDAKPGYSPPDQTFPTRNSVLCSTSAFERAQKFRKERARISQERMCISQDLETELDVSDVESIPSRKTLENVKEMNDGIERGGTENRQWNLGNKDMRGGNRWGREGEGPGGIRGANRWDSQDKDRGGIRGGNRCDSQDKDRGGIRGDNRWDSQDEDRGGIRGGIRGGNRWARQDEERGGIHGGSRWDRQEEGPGGLRGGNRWDRQDEDRGGIRGGTNNRWNEGYAGRNDSRNRQWSHDEDAATCDDDRGHVGFDGYRSRGTNDAMQWNQHDYAQHPSKYPTHAFLHRKGHDHAQQNDVFLEGKRHKNQQQPKDAFPKGKNHAREQQREALNEGKRHDYGQGKAAAIYEGKGQDYAQYRNENDQRREDYERKRNEDYGQWRGQVVNPNSKHYSSPGNVRKFEPDFLDGGRQRKRYHENDDDTLQRKRPAASRLTMFHDRYQESNAGDPPSTGVNLLGLRQEDVTEDGQEKEKSNNTDMRTPYIPVEISSGFDMPDYFKYMEKKQSRPKFDANDKKTKEFVPSHATIGILVEKCLPHTLAEQFSDCYSSRVGKFVSQQLKKGHVSNETPTDSIGKTPIHLIHESLKQCASIPEKNGEPLYGMEKIDLSSRYREMGANERSHRTLDLLLRPRREIILGNSSNVLRTKFGCGDLEVILMSVVVNRCYKNEEEKKDFGNGDTDCKERDAGLQLQVTHKKHELEHSSDWRFLTVIAIVPSAGVFYSPFRKYEKTRELVALPISWLRLKRNLKLTKDSSSPYDDSRLPPVFAKGGYVKSVAQDQMYRIWINLRNTNVPDVENINCVQVPFGDNKNFLPDYYIDENGVAEYIRDASHKRVRYDRELGKCKSVGVGKRNYIKGALYEKIPDSCLVLDVKRHKGQVVNFDLLVGVQRRGKPMDSVKDKQLKGKRSVSIAEETTIEIRYEDPTEQNNLDDLLVLCKNATELCKQQVRKSGDKGKMYAFGQKFDVYQKAINEFACNRKMNGYKRASDSRGLLATTSEGVLKFCKEQLPSVTRVLQDFEVDQGVQRSSTMGGPDHSMFLSNALFISEDLANAVHQDINDGCKCVCIWRETVSGWARNWYFILPDIVVQYPSFDDNGNECMITYQGVAIKLYDGIVISWDGRVIRHGTSVTRPVPEFKKGQENHTYGCVYVAKQTVVDAVRVEDEKEGDDMEEDREEPTKKKKQSNHPKKN